MNKRLPYEEELSKQLNDLPIPDQNVSWQDMKRRLDEDNDDGVIIPPPPQRGCLGYSLLLVVLAIILWITVRPDKWLWNKNQKNIVTSKEIYNKKNDTIVGKSTTENPQKNSRPPESLVMAGKDHDSIASANKGRQVTGDLLKFADEATPKQKIFNQREGSKNKYRKPGDLHRGKTSQPGITAKYSRQHQNVRKINKYLQGGLKSEIPDNEPSDTLKKELPDPLKKPGRNIPGNEAPAAINSNLDSDSATHIKTDSNDIKKKIKDIDSGSKVVKQNSTVKHPIYFAAGLALHQLLPINGQKLVPYNSSGRKGTLADYIPSVYFRVYKDKRWFLQSEFRYGAPQYTKEILYVQKKVVDTFTRTTLDTSKRLKKTYYHQLPVSFNYFVLPHLSIGLGLVWNKFSNAVSEQEVTFTNNVTQVDSVESKIVFHSKKVDTNFVKSYFQALVEIQYQWKRWSFGARYSLGLEPYIKFQLPGGRHSEEKNSSLQIFFRYDLWQSRKK